MAGPLQGGGDGSGGFGGHHYLTSSVTVIWADTSIALP